MTQEEAYEFCYEHQTNEDNYKLTINVFPSTDSDNGYEFRVVCNDIYHYLSRKEYEDLKLGMKMVDDDFDVTINEIGF